MVRIPGPSMPGLTRPALVALPLVVPDPATAPVTALLRLVVVKVLPAPIVTLPALANVPGGAVKLRPFRMVQLLPGAFVLKLTRPSALAWLMMRDARPSNTIAAALVAM